jgi:hypothetical protein
MTKDIISTIKHMSSVIKDAAITSRFSERFVCFIAGTIRFSKRIAHISTKKEFIMTEHERNLPQSEDALVDWGDNFTAQLEAEGTSLDIPTQETAAVKSALTTFKDLHTKASGPARNSIVTAEKKAAKEEFIRLVREMINFRFANPIITDAIRVQFGLHVKDHTYTPHGVPTTRPDFTLADKDFRRLNVDFRDQGAVSKAKPYGVSGAVISWSVLDHPPSGIEELTKAVLATRTPHVLEFEEAERGKTVYVILQWQNTKGDKGPPSEILWAIVP